MRSKRARTALKKPLYDDRGLPVPEFKPGKVIQKVSP